MLIYVVLGFVVVVVFVVVNCGLSVEVVVFSCVLGGFVWLLFDCFGLGWLVGLMVCVS